MGQDIQIVVVFDETATERRKEAIRKLANQVHQFITNGILIHTYKAMIEKPQLGEAVGNCHNIALGFMTDLINAGHSHGWFWIQGGNKHRLNDRGEPWEHSWLEFDGFAVDGTARQKDKPDMPTITIGESEFYCKARNIKKIIKRLDAAQTRRWIFKQAKTEYA